MQIGTIRPLHQNDMPQVINLWHTVFGDSPEYISSLFDHFPIAEIGWGTLLPSDRLVAMAFTLPLDIPEQKGYYLYACATAPEQQGQGHQSALIRKLIEEHRKKGTDTLLTLPATAELFPFYARFGFRKVSFVREKPATLPYYSPIQPEEYLAQRLNHSPYPTVESRTYLHWSIGEMRKEGFRTYQTPLLDRTIYTLSRNTDTDSDTLVADCFTRFHTNTANQIQFSHVTGMALALSDKIKQNKYYFSFLQDK